MIVVGLSHRTAPVEVRERLAINDAGLEGVLRTLAALGGVSEVMFLSTCNRVEVYAMAEREQDEAQVAAEIEQTLVNLGGQEIAEHLYHSVGSDALRHMLRVAAALDSLVVGEPQILGQFRNAAHRAQQLGLLGPGLRAATQHTLRVAKRVRTETMVGTGQSSIPSAAVSLARQIFEDLTGRTVVLIGAGDMAAAVAKPLAGAGARIVVVNRSLDRAERLAHMVGGSSASWADLESCLTRADIVITSTSSPGCVLTRQLVGTAQRARTGRSLFIVDIAVPRDVDPQAGKLEGVFLYDIDDLANLVASSLETRAQAAREAEALVDAELDTFERRLKAQRYTPVIVGLRQRTHKVLAGELERSLHGKLRHLSPEDRSALYTMIEAAANKLLHEPTVWLRDLAGQPDGDPQALRICELFGG